MQTIVALATPPGSGAIGVIRLSGNDALRIGTAVFNSSTPLDNAQGHTAHFGTIRSIDNHIIDEALATVFVAPRSYTGEDSIEFSCHGSPYILQQVIELLLQKGARLAEPGEFTMRAFLNGKLDLSQAEAVGDLIASTTAASHQVALRQMRGGFSKTIAQLREELIKFTSLIELELDFGEEDVEFADRKDLDALLQRILKVIRDLLDSFRLGNVLKNGISTVIAGRPNAGKSTLLNALLNEERAIVSEIAGTTRDTIEEPLNIKGVEFRLVDTAGIREAADAIEKIGVEKTMTKIQETGLLVYVFDAVEQDSAAVFEDLKTIVRPEVPTVVVANKMDWNPYFKPEELLALFGESPTKIEVVTISALQQMNMEHLKNTLYELAIGHSLTGESTIVSNSRHYDALRQAEERLAAAREGLQLGVTGDLLAMDIRQALNYLGMITGEISTDDLLERIFSDFCIGK